MVSIVFLTSPDNNEQVVGFGIYKGSEDSIRFNTRLKMIHVFPIERCLYKGLDSESCVCRLVHRKYI